MKKILMSILIGMLIMPMVGADENQQGVSDRVAIYAGLGTTQLDGQAVLSLNTRLSLDVYQWLEMGIAADVYHSLERNYTDALGQSYQAESGSAGLFIHPHWSVIDSLKAGLAITTGTNLIQLRYSGELRNQMTWTEEIPDRIVVAFNSIALTLEYSLCPVHSLFLETGYRQLHPFSTDYLEQEASTGGFFANIFYGVKL